MPAPWCIYKLMFYINLIKYLFNISEYKAMLIKLLIYHINIDVCVYVCIYMCVCVCVYISIYVCMCIYCIYMCVRHACMRIYINK